MKNKIRQREKGSKGPKQERSFLKDLEERVLNIIGRALYNYGRNALTMHDMD